jgi:hypothetical protein
LKLCAEKNELNKKYYTENEKKKGTAMHQSMGKIRTVDATKKCKGKK